MYIRAMRLKSLRLRRAPTPSLDITFEIDGANRVTASIGPGPANVAVWDLYPGGQVSNELSVAGTTTYALDRADHIASIQSPQADWQFEYNPTTD
jgi:hypothetical protein